LTPEEQKRLTTKKKREGQNRVGIILDKGYGDRLWRGEGLMWVLLQKGNYGSGERTD